MGTTHSPLVHPCCSQLQGLHCGTSVKHRWPKVSFSPQLYSHTTDGTLQYRGSYLVFSGGYLKMPRDPVCCFTLSLSEPEGMQVGEQGHVTVIYTRSPAGEEDRLSVLRNPTQNKTLPCSFSPPVALVVLCSPAATGTFRCRGSRSWEAAGQSRDIPASQAPASPHSRVASSSSRRLRDQTCPQSLAERYRGVQAPGGPGRKVAAEEQSQSPGAGKGSSGDSAVGCFFGETGTLCVKI